MTNSSTNASKILRDSIAQRALALICVFAAIILLWQMAKPDSDPIVLFAAGTVFTCSVGTIVWQIMNPDSVRARQTDAMLKLARQTLACMRGGLDTKSAQKLCELLLPTSAAIAVSITDRELVLGYTGFEEVENPAGKPIQTRATREAIDRGESLFITNADDIGFSFQPRVIAAAIIIPLRRGRKVVGALKFYFRNARSISETQRSIAEGYGHLLSTQISAEALEEQTKLTTSMELKALQAQINPHFLFNTINTIASFVRTDPDRARTLLREFAVFYRRTLEDTGDLVALSREVEQTTRYFYFEVARFGEDKLSLQVDFDEGVGNILIPAFLVQPLVENAVRHARPTEGKLTIWVRARQEGDFLRLSVQDDGIGMDEEHRDNILHPESSTGLGIAVRNVHNRVESFFGPGSHMEVESELGVGTTVTLVMNMESENLRRFIGAGGQVEESATKPDAAPSAPHQPNAHTTTFDETSSDPEALQLESAAIASTAEVHAAEVKSMGDLAALGEESGLNDELRRALSHMNEESTPARTAASQQAAYADDDDDWDYEAEMRALEGRPLPAELFESGEDASDAADSSNANEE